ncbi:hypothetical protein ACP70R_035785 [Stipagrostis hirtigluma subsp. patula]
MVLMAGASDRRSTAKPKPAPASPSPTPAPASTSRLIGEGFPKLSWGAHRILRCSKDGASSSPASAASPPAHPHTPSPEKEKDKDKPHGSPGACQPPRPWNLRARRSATVAPRSEAAGKAAAAAAGQAQQPLAPSPAAARKRGFCIALTKEEIAEDFDAIRGTRPPRRPKKRPRLVQRQVDRMCPGLSLANVTLDSYKIEEVIGAAVGLQIGTTFQMFSAFSLFL